MKRRAAKPDSNHAPERRQQLQLVRDTLLELHRALLTLESENHGREHRPLAPKELLQLLLGSKEFAWLRPMSSLIAEMDVLLDADHVPSAWAYSEMLQQAVTMFRLDDEAAEFTLKYREALQQSVEVAGRHGELRSLLRRVEDTGGA
jgi:hypothetical protein